jgi:hypothetical protein
LRGSSSNQFSSIHQPENFKVHVRKIKSFNVFLPKGRDWLLIGTQEDFNRN